MADDRLIEPEGVHEPHLQKTPRKAAISAWIGSALEYYDFLYDLGKPGRRDSDSLAA